MDQLDALYWIFFVHKELCIEHSSLVAVIGVAHFLSPTSGEGQEGTYGNIRGTDS